MIRLLRIRPEAEAELMEAAAWYEAQKTGLGADLLAVVDEAFERIVANPKSYAHWREDRPYRRCVVPRFPYVVFFTVEEQSILVVAVAHARRRPGYWIDRG